MVRSVSGYEKRTASSCLSWCVFVGIALLVPVEFKQIASADDFIEASRESREFSSDVIVGSRVVSSALEPTRLPDTETTARVALSAHEIAELAASRSAASHLVHADSSSRRQSAKLFGRENETSILVPFQNALAYRLRQISSANALKLHYAIAAGLRAERLMDETASILELQDQAQSQLVDRGVPIPDPLLLARLKTTLEDQRIENRSKLQTLRTQLAALIGPENACSHHPIENEAITPSDSNVCDHIEQAMRCRCDLITMKRLVGTINGDTLDVWDSIGAQMSGMPAAVKQASFWTKFLKTTCLKGEVECAVATRKSWLSKLISERAGQIVMEVEIAFEKKKSAALRWVNAGEQFSHWDKRIAQLEEIGRVHGNLAEQLDAKLHRLQSQGGQIERWLEWHQANIELKLAVGCD